MDSNLRELQKTEATHRLQLLEKLYKMHQNVLREFTSDETIYYSEKINKSFCGILYWLNNKQEYVDAVKEIEQKYNIYVYHCILSHTEFGDLLDMLFVSSAQEEWEQEIEDLKTGYVESYCYVFDGDTSEFGTIKIKGVNGGLTREY